MSKSAHAFDRCIVIFNPASTRAQRMEWRIVELAQLFPNDSLVVLHTSAEGRAANADMLVSHATKLGPRTLLAIIAGDGTVNEMVNVLLHDKRLDDTARQTVLLPLWGGNGNDLAHMLNGRRRHRPIQRLLTAANTVAVHPITFQISAPGSAKQRVSAVSYASFGASAYAARQLDQAKLRPSWAHRVPGVRFGHELYLVITAMVRASRYTVTVNETGQPMYEQLFMNGSRLAKVSALPLPITKKTFYYATVSQKHPITVARAIIDSIRGDQPGEADASKAIVFSLQEPIWAQFDGEVVKVAAGTTVNAGLSNRLVRVLSTKHQN